MNQSRSTFFGIIGVLALILLAFPIAGQNYPWQSQTLRYVDLPDPLLVTGVWDLEPLQVGIADLQPYIPIDDFEGLSVSYANEDGLFVATFGTVTDPTPDTKVMQQQDGVWLLQVGDRQGKAKIWSIGGSRWVGIAVWAVGTELPEDADSVLDALQISTS